MRWITLKVDDNVSFMFKETKFTIDIQITPINTININDYGLH